MRFTDWPLLPKSREKTHQTKACGALPTPSCGDLSRTAFPPHPPVDRRGSASQLGSLRALLHADIPQLLPHPD